MITLFVFIIAAGLFMLFGRLASKKDARPGGPHRLGLAFVATVLLSGGGGWAVDTMRRLAEKVEPVTSAAGAVDIYIPPSRGIPADGILFLIIAALYALSAIRGKNRQPAWIADILLLIASAAALS